MKIRKSKRGFLLVAAIFLLVVGGFVGTIISHFVTQDFSGSKSDLDSTQAFYIASAGLQHATYSATTNNLNDRVACPSISANDEFTGIDLGTGNYTVTAASITSANASLSATINSSTSIIPVTSLTNYTNYGRLLIDGEVIDYTSTSSDNNDCSSNAPCFLGAIRGVSGSDATSHSSGVSVVQNRCHIISTGTVAGDNSVNGRRVLSEDVFQIEQGWLVGNTTNGYENIQYWNGGSWSQYGPSSSIPDVHYNAIEMLNYAYGWVVGNKDSGQATLLEYDGSEWTRVLPASGTPDASLQDVTCTSENDCWAVGNSTTFLHWDGSSWTNGATGSLPNTAIQGVDCAASDDCWAVANSSLFIYWDGSSWTEQTVSVGNHNFNDVACTASDSCWSVGNGSTFAFWDGSTWASIAPNPAVPNKDIASISCINANDCWAAGAPQGGDSLIVHWDGVEWIRVTPGASVPNSSLYTINCANTNDCWTTGNSGVVAHWDGSSWSTDGVGSIPNGQTNGVAILNSLDSQPLIGNWQEDN
jgi:hypothetical protein